MTKMIKNKNLTFRARSDMRDNLAKAAAEHNRSLSEEIEERLATSFLNEARISEIRDRLSELEMAVREDRVTISRLTELLMAARDELAGKSGQDRVAPATSDVTQPHQDDLVRKLNSPISRERVGPIPGGFIERPIPAPRPLMRPPPPPPSNHARLEYESASQCFLLLRELIDSLRKAESEQERATIWSRADWLLDEIALAMKTAKFAALSEKLHPKTPSDAPTSISGQISGTASMTLGRVTLLTPDQAKEVEPSSREKAEKKP
jgi:Arc-like DNA binding domain